MEHHKMRQLNKLTARSVVSSSLFTFRATIINISISRERTPFEVTYNFCDAPLIVTWEIHELAR